MVSQTQFKHHSLHLYKDTRGDHKYIIQWHQISHCQRYGVESRGEEATTGCGHIHHQHHTHGSHSEGIKGGPQARQPVADYHEYKGLNYHSR